MIKLNSLYLLVCFCLIGIFISCGKQVSNNRLRIGITSIIEQPALVDARNGFEDALAKAGWDTSKVEIVYENAQGSTQKATQIATKFVGNEVDLIYAISTPSAVAVAQKTDKIPII